ncbi:MAG TPA: hypothetical protein VMU08_10980 [Rhizomicrobium sp.]|nr:hypothetical protein [Rhizomicrobium sp.]
MRSWPLSLLLGIGLLVVGAGPLLAIIVAASLGLTSDPNPNPIGPGLLFFFTFWPALGLIAFGVLRLMAQKRTPGPG